MENEDLFEAFKDTLSNCGSYLLEKNDEVVGYNIFEEFDIGVISFLYIDCLKQLVNSGYISIKMMNKCLVLRSKVLKLGQSNEWNIYSFRNSESWRSVIELCDIINLELGNVPK